MDKPPIAEILEAAGVPRAKQHNKWACVWCESSDALHDYGMRAKCFSCGRHGDSIDVFQTVNNCDFKTALKTLNISRPWRFEPYRRNGTPIKKRKKMDVNKLWRALPVMSGEPKTNGGRACVEYLKSHGVTLDEAQRLPVRIVPSNRWWADKVSQVFDEVPPEMQFSSGDIMPYCPALAFGYRDNSGAVVQMRFRQIGSSVKVASMRLDPMLLDLSDAVDDWAHNIVVCEGEPDAIAIACAGVASVGVPGASQRIVQDDFLRLVAGRPKRFIVAAQGDEVSQQWGQNVAESLAETGCSVWLYKAPEGMDIADMVRMDRDRALIAVLNKGERI